MEEDLASEKRSKNIKTVARRLLEKYSNRTTLYLQYLHSLCIFPLKGDIFCEISFKFTTILIYCKRCKLKRKKKIMGLYKMQCVAIIATYMNHS